MQVAATCPIPILIVDDHRLFRDALRALLASEPDLAVVAEAENATEAIQRARDISNGVVLLDVAMPGMSGIAALPALRATTASNRIILLTAAIKREEMLAAFRLGVCGVVLKELATAVLLNAIRRVAGGAYWLIRDMASSFDEALQLLDSEPVVDRELLAYSLTSRESDILGAIASGCANKDIAVKLSISEQAVKHYLTSIFAKTRTSRRTELALIALRLRRASKTGLSA